MRKTLPFSFLSNAYEMRIKIYYYPNPNPTSTTQNHKKASGSHTDRRTMLVMNECDVMRCEKSR